MSDGATTRHINFCHFFNMSLSNMRPACVVETEQLKYANQRLTGLQTIQN